MRDLFPSYEARQRSDWDYPQYPWEIPQPRRCRMCGQPLIWTYPSGMEICPQCVERLRVIIGILTKDTFNPSSR